MLQIHVLLLWSIGKSCTGLLDELLSLIAYALFSISIQLLWCLRKYMRYFVNKQCFSSFTICLFLKSIVVQEWKMLIYQHLLRTHLWLKSVLALWSYPIKRTELSNWSPWQCAQNLLLSIASGSCNLWIPRIFKCAQGLQP